MNNYIYFININNDMNCFQFTFIHNKLNLFFNLLSKILNIIYLLLLNNVLYLFIYKFISIKFTF